MNIHKKPKILGGAFIHTAKAVGFPAPHFFCNAAAPEEKLPGVAALSVLFRCGLYRPQGGHSSTGPLHSHRLRLLFFRRFCLCFPLVLS